MDAFTSGDTSTEQLVRAQGRENDELERSDVRWAMDQRELAAQDAAGTNSLTGKSFVEAWGPEGPQCSKKHEAVIISHFKSADSDSMLPETWVPTSTVRVA